MRLRTRFLLVLAVFTVVMITAAVMSARIVLTVAALRADEAGAQVLLERGKSVLEAEAENLSSTVEDWAARDDTYNFMADRNAHYREANLVEGTLKSLRVDAIAYYDTNRHDVAGVTLARDGLRVDAVPPGMRDLVDRSGGVLDRAADTNLSGFAVQESNLWLLAAAPILTGKDQGPSRGILVMARLINEDEGERLSRLIDPSASLVPAAQGWSPGTVEIRAAGMRTLLASVAMADIFGSGRLALQLSVPRMAFDQVALNLSYLTIWVVVCGAGLSLVSVWLLNRWVLGSVTESVTSLRNGLVVAARPGGGRQPLKKAYDDEIGELFDAVEAAIGAVEISAREADRRRAEAIQSQRLAALGLLAAGVAHEINNPNGIVNLNLNVMRRELERLFARIRAGVSRGGGGTSFDIEPMEKELREILGETLSASDRIAGIVAALKSFARPVADADKANVAVSDLLDEASRWLRHEYEKAQCRLEISIAPALPPLRGNRQQLVQVFVNLLQNACQAATRPGMPVRVSASCDRETGGVAIAVADEGKGMPPEDIEHAMDPFFTTRRSEGGTGLGLSITAAIVKAHGGSLRIEARQGAGTVVTVILPVEERRDTHGE